LLISDLRMPPAEGAVVLPISNQKSAIRNQRSARSAQDGSSFHGLLTRGLTGYAAIVSLGQGMSIASSAGDQPAVGSSHAA
jgi:hypothetical protein